METFEENVTLQRRLPQMYFDQFFQISITIAIFCFDWQDIV